MVIELTDGLARCPQDKLEGLAISVENLLTGYYEGNLILVISRPLCAFIRGRGLVKTVRADKALRHIETGGGYIPAVLWRLQVVLENPDSTNHEVEYTFFNRSVSVQPTAFLCENLDDIKFYMKLVRIYYPTTPIRAMRYHGGGDTTVDVFTYLKGLQVACLVILDSDIKYPGCKLGETARKCLAKQKTASSYVEVKMLDVHEAENLVPIAFMKQNACQGGKALLKRMTERRLLNTLVTFDVKSGIQKQDVEQDSKYNEYCEKLYNELYRPRKNTYEVFLRQKRNGTDFVFSQVRANLLDKFNEDRSLVYPSDILSPQREAIAQLVHTFVCCRGYDPLN